MALENHPRIHDDARIEFWAPGYTADTLGAIRRLPLHVRNSLGAEQSGDHPLLARLAGHLHDHAHRGGGGAAGLRLEGLASPARRFEAGRIDPDAALLPLHAAAAWTYLDDRLDPASSTAIRARGLWPVGPA